MNQKPSTMNQAPCYYPGDRPGDPLDLGFELDFDSSAITLAEVLVMGTLAVLAIAFAIVAIRVHGEISESYRERRDGTADAIAQTMVSEAGDDAPDWARARWMYHPAGAVVPRR